MPLISAALAPTPEPAVNRQVGCLLASTSTSTACNAIDLPYWDLTKAEGLPMLKLGITSDKLQASLQN
jgi:hypothetical protein